MARRKLPAGVTRRVGRSGKVTYQARWRNAAGEVCSFTADTAAEAAEYRTERLRERRYGATGDLRGGNIRFDTWFAEWMASRDIRDSTRDRDLSYARNHILPVWGTHRLSDIHVEAVDEWVRRLSSSGIAPATASKTLQIFAACMKRAVLLGHLLANPCDPVGRPRVPDVEMRFLTETEVLDLASAMDPWWSLTVNFLADTGLRIGELAALRSVDVDTRRGRVTVRATATYASASTPGRETRRRESAPKTRAGYRVVPTLTLEVGALVNEMRQARHIEPGDLLFTGPKGGPLSPGNYRRRVFDVAVREAQLATPLPTPHALRHTAISRCIATGRESTYKMARWAGHRTTAVFEGRYAHILDIDAEPVRSGLSERRRQAEQQVEEYIVRSGGNNVVDIKSRRLSQS